MMATATTALPENLLQQETFDKNRPMKKSLLLLLFAVTASSAFAQLNITTNTTWSGTVYMTQDVIVQAGATLTIQEGTTIAIGFVDDNLDGKGDVEMIINGKLRSLGSPCSPVSFEPLVATTNKNWWVGIKVASNDTSLLQSTAVGYATNALEITGRCETNGLYTSYCGLSGVYANGASFAKLQAVHSTNDSTGIRALNANGISIDWCKVDNCTSNAFQFVGSTAQVSNSMAQNISVCGLYAEDSNVDIENASLNASNGMAGIMTSNGTVTMHRSSFRGKAMGLLITAGGTITGDSLELTGTNPVVISDFEATLQRFAGFAIFTFRTQSNVPSIIINNSNLNRTGSYEEIAPLVYPVYGLAHNWNDAGEVITFGWGNASANAYGTSISTPGYNNWESPIRMPFGFATAFIGDQYVNSNGSKKVKIYVTHERSDGTYFNATISGCASSGNPASWSVPANETFNLVRYRLLKTSCASYSTCSACYEPGYSDTGYYFTRIKTRLKLNPAHTLSSTYRSGSHNFNFQFNYWSELSDIASRVYQINTASNINYNGFSPVAINNVGSYLDDDGYTAANFPTYVLNGTGNVVCTGSNTTTTISGPYSISNVNYDWIFNGSSYGETASSIQPPAVGNYALNLSNGSGCSETSAPLQLVSEQFISSASIATPNGLSACQGEALTLDGSAYSNYNLTWFRDGAQVGTGTTYSAAQTGNYTMQVTSQSGNCSLTSPPVSLAIGQYPSGSIGSVGIPQICGGDSLLLRVTAQSTNSTDYQWYLNGQPLSTNNDSIYATASGTYTLDLATDIGCVSTASNAVNVTVLNTPVINNNVTVCNGESYSYNGNTYSQAGQYSNVFQSVTGCDSTVVVNLTVSDTALVQQSVVLCSGESVTVGGNVYSTNGIYTDMLQGQSGCDSTLITTVSVLPTTGSSETVATCNQSYTWNNQTFSQSGTYNYTNTAINGCDSILELNITFLPQSFSVTSVSICGVAYAWNNQVYAQPGTYDYLTQNSVGCDSTATLILDLTNEVNIQVDTVICFGETYSAGGSTYTTSGQYTNVIGSFNGCDTIQQTALTVLSEITASETVSACDQYSWNGTNYTTGGNYQFFTTSSVGCDSTITLNLSLGQSNSTTQNVDICLGDSIIVGQTTYLASGVYTDILTNSNGCDSTVVTTITTEQPVIPTIVGPVNISPFTQYNYFISQPVGYSINWSVVDGAVISGQGTTSATVVWNGATGLLAVEITNGICTSFDTIQVGTIITGLSQLNEKDIRIYPNPSIGIFNVMFTGSNLTRSVALNVTDPVGRKVYMVELIPSNGNLEHKIDISNEAPGVYFIELNDGVRSYFSKIIKE